MADFNFKAEVPSAAPGFNLVGSNFAIPAGSRLDIHDCTVSGPGQCIVQLRDTGGAVQWEWRLPTGGDTNPGEAVLTLSNPAFHDGAETSMGVFVDQDAGAWASNGFVAFTGTLAPIGEN